MNKVSWELLEEEGAWVELWSGDIPVLIWFDGRKFLVTDVGEDGMLSLEPVDIDITNDEVRSSYSKLHGGTAEERATAEAGRVRDKEQSG